MSLHKFGYSEGQEILAQITHSKLKEDFENELENELGNLSEN